MYCPPCGAAVMLSLQSLRLDDNVEDQLDLT